MADKEMPIFSRTFDMITWLVPVSAHFPRQHRHSFTLRLQNAAFTLREHLEEAQIRRGELRMERLSRAEESLAHLRVYIRMAVKWTWLSLGQYEHVSKMLDEIGRLLGGWIKSQKTRV